jgi:four helix bundle protein
LCCEIEISMRDSIIKTKSYKFAVRIVKLYKHFKENLNEHTLSKQLLRSGTSIAANTSETLDAQSDMDFIHKFSIAQKECSESIFWIKLLYDTEFINKAQFESLYDECNQLHKIITSIILTKKQNTRRRK